MPKIQELDYMGVQDACALAGIVRQHLTRLAKAGAVPGAALLAGRLVFDRAAFTPWAAEVKARQKRKRPLTEK